MHVPLVRVYCTTKINIASSCMWGNLSLLVFALLLIQSILLEMLVVNSLWPNISRVIRIGCSLSFFFKWLKSFGSKLILTEVFNGCFVAPHFFFFLFLMGDFLPLDFYFYFGCKLAIWNCLFRIENKIHLWCDDLQHF